MIEYEQKKLIILRVEFKEYYNLLLGNHKLYGGEIDTTTRKHLAKQNFEETIAITIKTLFPCMQFILSQCLRNLRESSSLRGLWNGWGGAFTYGLLPLVQDFTIYMPKGLQANGNTYLLLGDP